MSKYSNQFKNIRGKKRTSTGEYVDADFLYNYINKTITSTTIQKREQLKTTLDDFCTFYWRGIDAFKTFGAFIINKNDLKFYNGPSFSNDYTQPQFESAATQLVGVKFKTQQISFTIGVYWISIEHYRQLIYWLHPYEVNTLAFGFDKEHYYQVKLASISDSTRTIIGKENIDGKVEDRYYTELKLTFEVQGSPCAYNNEQYLFEFDYKEGISTTLNDTTIEAKVPSTDNDALTSDLPAPVEASIALMLGLNTENFRTDTGYTISNTNWRLINSIVFDDLIEINSGLHFTCFDEYNVRQQYTGFKVTSNTIQYKQGSTWKTVYSSGQWLANSFAALEYGDCEEVSVEMVNFLITNNRIDYYSNMKINCQLLVGMHAYEDGDGIHAGSEIPPKTLFDITLKNLTWGNSAEQVVNDLFINYDSEDGLLYLSSADSKYFLLNTLSTSAKGQRIVDNMVVKTFAIPGNFNDPCFDIKQMYFQFIITTWTDNGSVVSPLTITGDTITGEHVSLNPYTSMNCNKSYINLRGRTNLI